MMRTILFFLFIIFQFSTFAQTTISGIVTDSKNNPIFGANVYLEGTYDGASTTEEGKFSFLTTEKGNQTLVVSFLSFETFMKTGEVTSFKNITNVTSTSLMLIFGKNLFIVILGFASRID